MQIIFFSKQKLFVPRTQRIYMHCNKDATMKKTVCGHVVGGLLPSI